MKYPFLLFDLDMTLLHFIDAEYEALGEAFFSQGLLWNEEVFHEYHSINTLLWRSLERGDIDIQQLQDRRFSTLFKKRSIDLDGRAFNDHYLRILSHKGQLMPGTKDLIPQLKDHRLFVATNGIATVQRGRLQVSGLLPFFEKIYISEEIGYSKPQVEFFEAIFEDLGNPPKEQFLMIGDSLQSDIKGAKDAGIACCLYDPNDQHSDDHCDYRIRHLQELLLL